MTAGPRVRTRVGVPLGRAVRVDADVVSFDGLADGLEHVAVVVPPLRPVPLVRVHSECLTGDVLGSLRCDCGAQLDEALRRLAVEGGVLLYLRQEGRGIGLYDKLDAYAVQDRGVDTYAANEAVGHGADERTYGVAAQMLQALGIGSVVLLTNNPHKVGQLRAAGVHVAGVERTGSHRTPENAAYLTAKRVLGGHDLAP